MQEKFEGSLLEVVHERCAGIDVHKEKIKVCFLAPNTLEIREFGTMTSGLLDCIAWLEREQCQIILMESTGSYWKPVYNLFEASEIKIKVANAMHVKAIKNQKSDKRDAKWLATLLRFDLVEGSFIPPRDQRELRELIRYRNSLVEERAREVNRIQKVLEGANIKLSSVVSNIQGVSSMSILRLIVSGEVDPIILSQQAVGKLRDEKIPQLQQALKGSIGPHQQTLLMIQLGHYDNLTNTITTLDDTIKKKLKTDDWAINLLDTIPGVGRRSAERILAEIGPDMSKFKNADALAKWAGLSPGQHESAGKNKAVSALPGNAHLRTTLVECAQAAVRSKTNFFYARFKRISTRRGYKRAIVAVARSILVAIFSILKDREPYHDLGADYFLKRDAEKIANNNLRSLERLGYTVSITPPPQAISLANT